MDKRGTDFYDVDLDRAFVKELKKKLRSDIEIIEVDADLDTSEFAQELVKAFQSLLT